MFREIPTSNRLLQKRWQDKEQQIHLRKLKNIKSCLNINRRAVKPKTSKGMTHERLLEIERENKILLQKMTKIMSRNNSESAKPFEKKSLNKEARK